MLESWWNRKSEMKISNETDQLLARRLEVWISKTNKETKNSQQAKVQDQMASLVNSTKHSKNSYYKTNLYQTLPKNLWEGNSFKYILRGRRYPDKGCHKTRKLQANISDYPRYKILQRILANRIQQYLWSHHMIKWNLFQGCNDGSVISQWYTILTTRRLKIIWSSQ